MMKPPYSSRILIALALVLVVAVVIAIMTFVNIAHDERTMRSTQSLLAEQTHLVHRMVRLTNVIAVSGPGTLPGLEALRGSFDGNLAIVRPRLDDLDPAVVETLERRWSQAGMALDTLAETVSHSPGRATEAATTLAQLTDASPADAVSAALARELARLQAGLVSLAIGIEQPELESSLAAALREIDRDPRLQRLQQYLTGPVADLVTQQHMLIEMRTLVQHFERSADQVIAAIADIDRQLVALRQVSPYRATFGYGLSILALLCIFLLAGLLLANARVRRTAATQAVATARQQQSILRLLKEMSSLAEGDLTVHATVTRDVTGAIADAINYAVDALRKLVATINHTAIKVAAAAHQSSSAAEHLNEASSRQADQVEAAGEAMNRIAGSINRVSRNAQTSSEVARKQVKLAHEGGEAVRRTIAGMSKTREQIQETAKRIKRLGESSQEIGDMVELINGIAEQTNILALNAAIQASAAGDAGKGFAVVADEVQRLAERVSGATKQIEVLVQNIQSDTNEAVVSMEQSTAGVVSGARLAENAGASLVEIESVARRMAEIIEDISEATAEQAQSAEAAQGAMGEIQGISGETADAAGRTAEAIAKLTELATQLHESIEGFKLPPTDPTASGQLALDQLRKVAKESGRKGKDGK